MPTLKDYDAYLFDWDGTLVRTIEIWIEALVVMVNHFGGNGDRKFLSRTLGDMNAPLQCGVPVYRADEFQRSLAEYAVPRLAGVGLYDGAKEYVQRLKSEGKKVALITTSRRETFELVMRRHELDSLFDLVIAQADVREHKPHPEGILTALHKLGVHKSRALMLGDSSKDLGAAKSAGVDCLLFYPEAHVDVYSPAELLAYEPVRIIKAWEELRV